MRTNAPALLPLFRSRPQAEMLAWLYLHPDDSWTLTEVAAAAGAPLATAHRQIDRLVEAGLVAEQRVGRNRMLSASQEHPAAGPLSEVLALTFGPPAVIAQELEAIPHIDVVVIFGSWAARYAGEPGPAPHDIDVMVVGDGLDQSDVFRAAERAEARLGLPVNPVLRSSTEWVGGVDLLSEEVKGGPHLIIDERGPHDVEQGPGGD